jgi:hypothetical protein
MVLCPVIALSIGQSAIAISSQHDGAAALIPIWTLAPPDLASILLKLEDAIASMQAAVVLGLPSVSFGLPEITALVASINGGYPILVALDAMLNAAIGLFSYSYEGNGNSLGAALTSELGTQWPDGSPTTAHVDALIFGADIAVPVSALTGFFGGLSFGPGLQFGGKYTLAQLCPVVHASIGEGVEALNVQLAAALALLKSVQVTPPSFGVIIPQLKFKLNANDLLPKIDFVLAALGQMVLGLQIKFNRIIALGALLREAGATMFVYEYSGAANAMGAAVTGALASTWGDGFTPTTGPCVAIVLGAVDSLTLTVMNAYFGGA